MRHGRDVVAFNYVGAVIVALLVVFAVLPFWTVIMGSLMSDREISLQGYRLWPETLTLTAYRTVFRVPQRILRAYGVSMFVTIVGTAGGLFLTSSAGYVMSRRDFRYRNVFAFYFYFTALFSGGMVPTYLLYASVFELRDSLAALILPIMSNAWFTLLMRNFISTVPFELSESAKIDGASDFSIYLRIVLPLSKPGLAAIGLFLGLQYWNDWFQASLYIRSEELYPLQYYLYEVLKTAEFLQSDLAAQAGIAAVDIPRESTKLATAVIVTAPILLLYPLLQRYIVQGLLVGSVKG